MGWILAITAIVAATWVAMRGHGDAWTWATGGALGLVFAFALHDATPRRYASFGRRAKALVVLLGGFLWELLLSNVQQLRLVLAPRLDLQPVWLRFDSRLQTAWARAALGTLISMTPGTITCAIDEDGPGAFCVHALDARDEARTIARIRTLFEGPLLVLEGIAREEGGR